MACCSAEHGRGALFTDALEIYGSGHGEMMHLRVLTSRRPAMDDGITRIPFIVRWPGPAEAGQPLEGRS
jgi:arylsulfatase A-like enzyme